MANKKISELASATTPLSGAELIEIVQSGTNKQVAASALIGATGPQGDPGAPGADGLDGSDGADGRTVLSGPGAPSSGLGANGDFYIDTTDWDIYGPKTVGAWGSGTSLVGPAGAPGADGLDGSDGADGAQLDAANTFTEDQTIQGDLVFSGAARRIYGDFSTATYADRFAFQTNVTNGATTINCLPNGTNTAAIIGVFNNSDPTNAAYGYVGFAGGSMLVNSAITGTGTYKDLVFMTGGVSRMLVNTTGVVTILSSPGFGYGAGSGGTVTQDTSRTTGVTINKASGAITLVSAAGSTAFASFTVTNSTVATTDCIIVNQKSGTDLYEIHVTNVAAGSFKVSFRTISGTTTEQPVFNFAVIKGATS